MPRAPMPRPTPWPRAALAALFMAFALTTLAPDNAAAQETDTNPLELGTVSGFNLDLIWPVTATDGKLYYFLDRSGDGIATGRVTGNEAISDTLTTGELKTLLNNGNDVTATQDGNHDGSDDARSVLVSASGSGLTYTLVLPTIAEFDAVQALATSKTTPNGFDPSQPDIVGGSPPNWLDGGSAYATANISMAGEVDNFYYYLDQVGMRFPGFPSSGQDDSSTVGHLAVAFQVIAPTAPDAPTGVTATNGNGQSIVTWTAANSGGSAVLSYTATASPDGTFSGADATCSTTATPTCTITGLTNGTVYEITVVATNAVGTSDPSGGDVTASPGIPGIPTGVTLTAGNGQIVVRWMAPSDIGGSAILGYDARPFIVGGGLQASSICTADGADADTCTITGLTNNTQYRVVVRARNAHGYSVSSPNEFATPSFLRFSETVAAAQTFSVGQTVALTLPEATGGIGTYAYTLTPDLLIPDGLTFDGATRTLSGIPTTPATVPTLQYTVTDSISTFSQIFSVTIEAVPELMLLSQTVADRTYPVTQRTGGQAAGTITISTVILPRATGGLGRLNYELSPLPSDGISGLGYAPATRTIFGTPGANIKSQVFTYTVTDNTAPDAQTASLTFKISVVDVQGDGTIVADTDGTALAVNDVGTTGHNLRLFLPDGHIVTEVEATTYTPDSATAPVRYVFSGVAMDIDLDPGSATSIPTDATVCLSTTDVPATNHAPALFLGTTGGAHVQGTPDGWVNIGSEIRTRGGDEYVCGETREFAPYFAVASTSTVPDIILTPTDLTFAEGSTTTYTVVLAALPTADVTVTITGPTGAEVTPTPAVLTFTTGDWSTAQTVTLTPAADADAVDEAAVTLTHTANGGGYGNVAGNVTVTVTDDDTAGLTLTPGALTFDEESTATYTVVLDTEPSAPVTVTITGHATTDLATTPPNPNPLTFTTTNWNTPQTVTLTAAEDDDTTNDSVTLMHTADGGDYTGLGAVELGVTVTDIDVPGLLLSPTAVTMDEGTTATYTVRLTTTPSAAVTVTVGGFDNTDLATIAPSPTTLTFTTMNFNAPQTFTLTAAEDDDATNEAVVNLTHTVMSEDTEYASVSRNLPVNINDNDMPGLTLSATDLTLAEGSTTATYTAVLATLPTANVTVTINIDNTDITTTPDGLTFTADNWNTPQTLTFTAAEDGDVMDDSATLTHTIRGGDDYTGLDAVVLDVTVTDNDLAFNAVSIEDQRHFIHQEINLTLPEAMGGVGAVTYTLDRVSGSPLLPDGVTFDRFARTISGTPTEVFDEQPPISLAYGATDSASPAKTGFVPAFLFRVIDERGISLTPTTVTMDEGGTATYAVALTSTPSEAVTVTISGHDADGSDSANDLAIMSPASGTLIFDETNWNMKQTVTLTADRDMEAMGTDEMNDMVTLTHTASGGDYTGLPAVTVDLVVNITDTGGPNLILPTSLMLGEGVTATYTVRLTTMPDADVTVTVGGFTSTDVTPTPTVLTFTTADWMPEQTVTIVVAEDDDAVVDDTVILTHTVASSTGNYMTGVAVRNLPVTITETDAVGLTLTPATLTLDKGGTATYTAVLDTEPTADVTVTIASSNSDVAPTSPTLSFATTNWNTAQTVTLTYTYTAQISATLTHTASGGDYGSVTADLTVNDADMPPISVVPPLTFASTVPDRIYPASVAISPITLPVASGGTGTYVYRLDSSTPPTGLEFNADARTLTGTPTASASLVYRATDNGTPPASGSLTFSVSVVMVTVVGGGTYESVENGAVLAFDNVGGEADNDIRLSLSGGLNEAPELTVTTYTPNADTVPASYTFSGVAVDITLTLPPNTEATVCLSTVGVPDGHNPALFHYDTSEGTGNEMWDFISDDTITRDGNQFVCGTTDSFSPVAVASTPDTSRLTTISEIILPEVARAMTDNTVRAITQRFDQARTARQTDTAASAFTLGGQSTLADVLRTGGQALADGTLNMNNILGNSAFVLPLSSGGGVADTLTLWGSGGYSGLGGGGGGAMDWDGNLVSAHLGADAQIHDTLLAGAAISWNQGDFDYGALTESPKQGGGNYAIEMTSITPYAEWAALPDDRLNIWGTAGYGEGEVTIIDNMVAAQTNDTSMVLWGGGASGRILKNDAGELRLKSEVMQTQLSVSGGGNLADLTVEARRMRVSLAGTTTHTLADGAHLTPTIEVGMRNDSGSGRTGTGAEVGGGVRYAAPVHGITFESRSRVLLGHTGDYDDWGIGGALAWNTGQGGQGLALRLAPTYGQTQTQTAQLWDQGAMDLTGTDAAALGQRMDAEVGYGLTALDGQGLLTPYSKMTWGQGARAYRLGSRLTLASGLTMSFEGVRGETLGATAPAHHLQWQTGWRWLTASMQASGVERRMQLQAEWQW